MKCIDFKTINVYAKDHEILSSEAARKDYKMCVMFNKIMKKNFPKRYEVK